MLAAEMTGYPAPAGPVFPPGYGPLPVGMDNRIQARRGLYRQGITFRGYSADKETPLDRRFSTRWKASGSSDAGSDLARADSKGPGQELSRRKIFKKAVVVGAVGAAGGSVLTEVMASPASAATTTEPGAVAPAVVALTDAATIAVDASLGNDFRVTIAGSRTMGNPSNPTDGQKITFQVTQGTAGSAAITWGSSYEFSTGLPQPTLSTTAGETDLLAFIYNAAKGNWLLAAFVNGFP